MCRLLPVNDTASLFLIYRYLGSLQENLSLLLFLPLLLHLIQLLKEFKLGTHIADLLVPLVLLMDERRYRKVRKVQQEQLNIVNANGSHKLSNYCK